MQWVHLDGEWLPSESAQLSVLNHGLLYGDGLFETLRWQEGHLFRPNAHLARLRASAQALDLELPWSEATLLATLREAALRNALSVGGVRLTVLRGEGPPVPDPSVCGAPHFLITARRFDPPDAESWQRGLSLCVAGPHPRPGRPGIKSLSYLPFQEARRSARQRGYDDGILLDGDCVVETGVSNLFAVRRGVLLTPGTESGCLPGIARAVVLELAADEGLRVEERPLRLEEALHADELFVTNTLQTLAPVTRLEDRQLSLGPVTKRLAERYAECLRREASVRA